MPWKNSNRNQGETAKTRGIRNRLADLGVDTSRYGALPEDEGIGRRERRGFLRENVRLYGKTWAENAIGGRVDGHLDGKRDT